MAIDMDKLTDEEKALVAIQKRFELMSVRQRRQILKEVANRLNSYRVQEPEVLEVDANILGGPNKVGVMCSPRCVDEPYYVESKYILCTIVDDEGVQKAQVVTLKVYEDWKCQEAIAWAKGMVARACSRIGQKGINFSTRMQTEVQTRVVIMWMRLHGRFFWNSNRKSFSTSLHFDAEKKILRRIDTDDFKSWLMNHADVNMGKSDFEFLMNDVNAMAMNPDVSHGVVPNALFNRRTINGEDFIYISNGDSMMMKIGASSDGRRIENVPNGTDDVVFLAGETLEEWELADGDGVDPFLSIPPFSTANYESTHGAMIARMWILSLAACQDSFPAILFTGKARSGKSRTAKAVQELLGAPKRLASIEPGNAGKKDFWTVVNKGGVVCFDNVDTRIDWFSDAMQQACTDGSFESRSLFTNDEVSTLLSNARIILTSNNPLFASESGLADRLLIVRLGTFDGANGKEAVDTALTLAIKQNRNEAMTWLARTISKALADREPVEGNINFRHPDFAEFALRASRALGMYDEAKLALKSAEFDKSLITVQENPTVKMVYEALLYHFDKCKKMPLPDQLWEGSATEMLRLIIESHPSLKRDDGSLKEKDCPKVETIGRMINRYIDQLAVIFDLKKPKIGASGCQNYTFYCHSEAYKRNVLALDEDYQKTISDENDMPF